MVMSTESLRPTTGSPQPESAGSWLTEGLLDAEYKEYVLLAWLQKVHSQLRDVRLYPALSDVIGRHRELKSIQHCLHQGREQGAVTGIDFTRMQLLRGGNESPSSVELYLEELINRALPHLNATMAEGKSLFDLIDSKVEFTPIGVQPLHMGEGYLLVTHGSAGNRELLAFRYTQSRIQRNGDAFLELSLECRESRRLARLETLESIKWGLIRKHRDLPQPATFHAHTEWEVPIQPTLLPIARRRLLQEIAQC